MLHGEKKESHSQVHLASTAYYSLYKFTVRNNLLKALRIPIGRNDLKYFILAFPAYLNMESYRLNSFLQNFGSVKHTLENAGPDYL